MVVGNTTTSPWRIGGKSLSAVNRTFTSTNAISGNIVKIDIDHGAASNITINSMKVEVATDADFSKIVSTLTPTFAASTVVTVEHPSTDDAWEDCFYRITYNMTNSTTTNRYLAFKSAKFYKEKSASAPDISATPDLIDFGTVDVGATVASQTVAVTFANLTGSVTYSGLSNPFSASGTISATGDEITISADATNAGTFEQTLTIQSAADSKSVDVTVKMKVATPTGTFELFSGDLEEGDYVLVSTNALSNSVNSNRLASEAVTISDDKIINPDASVVWHIAPVSETSYWTLYNEASEKYAGGTTTKNQGALLANVTDYAKWTITKGTNVYEFVNLGRENGSSDTGNKYLRYNSSNAENSRWACYGSGTGSAPALYKKSDGTSKQAAGLAYAAADAQKLVKVGGSLDAPTLSNDNNLSVSYASSNTDVVEVNASTGAITAIKAAGKAVITASSAETDTYKAGSASYTIFVAEQAGTADDPLTEASAKALIDGGCTLTVHVNGVIATATYNSTYFNYAVTLTNGFQFYRLKDLNNADFSSDYLGSGDEVTAVGALKKHNSTYELDEGCYLTFYEQATTQLTPIANTKETAYTVAQALAFAAAPTTYDLSDHVYIAGVVYDVKNFNSTNGTYDIYIKDAGTSENDGKFEFYKCAGLYQVGEDAVPFEEGDVQEGDEVIGYGVMTYYSGGSIWEFGQPNQLVSLNRPTVAVTGVELASTATVKVGNSINLSASVLPANATDKVIEWSIQSGNANITLNNGTVTGVAEGEAVVRATSHADNTKYAECTITIAAADPVYAYYNYEKVTAAADIEDGEYLIVYECEDGALAFNGGLETLDAVENTIAVTIEDNRIESNATTDAAAFTIDVTNGTLLAASGKYIGVTSYSNGLTSSDDPIAHSSFSIAEGSAVIVVTTTGGNMTLRYNKANNQLRFRYYKSGQEAIQLYKKVGTNEAPKSDSQLAWDPADDIEITVGDAFSAPALLNPNNIDAAEITIASNNTDLATVTNGVVALVANATGEATITATFAGNNDYKPATVSYNITVNAAAPTPAVSGNVVIIAEYDSKFYALTTNVSNKTAAAVEVEKDGSNIVVTSAEAKAAIQWTRTVDGENTTFKDADDKYLKGTSGGGDLTLADAACNWSWNATDEYYYIGSRSFIYRESANGFKNYSTQNAGTSDYSSIAEVIEIDPENIIVVVPTTHTLSYNPNGGTLIEGEDAIADAQVAEGATVTVAANVYEKDGYSFTGWLYGETVYNAGQTFPMPTTDVELVAQWTEQVVSDYVLVTDVAQLQAGDKVIIVAADYNVAAGSAAATYRNVVDIEKTSDKSKLIFGASMPTEFTLGIPADGEYSFNDGDGFMYEAAAKSVKVQAESFSWSISIDANAIATISATNELRYNSTNPRFTTYASGQSALQLYRKPAPEPVYTEVRTGLTIGKHYTICLKKKITAVKGGTFWTIGNRDANYKMAYLVEAPLPLTAGEPFIFQATADKLEVVYEGADASEPAIVPGNALRGTFDDLSADNIETLLESCPDMYMLYDNKLCRVVNGNGNTLAANRAYLDDNAMTVGAPQSAPGRQVRAMPMHGNVATGIDNALTSDQPMKMLIDGQLFIIRGEKMYDATGRLVK